MSPLLSTETLAKSAGHLYLAPLGTGAPADDDLGDLTALTAAGWVHAGWLTEDGPTPAGFEGSNTKFSGWNSVAPIRSITRVTEPTIEVSLLQWNQENLELYFPEAEYDAGTRVLKLPESGNPTEQEILVTVADGAAWLGLWAAKVTARGGGGLDFPGDGLAPIPLVFDVLGTGDDDLWVHVIGVDPAGEGGS